MASDYNNIDLRNEIKNEEEPGSEIGYPLHVHFYELVKMSMHVIPWHWHPELEILIVNHGEIDFMTNDKVEVLHAGQGIIINANVMHSVGTSLPDANCSFYSTTFNPAFLFGYGDILMSEKYMTPVVKSKHFQYMIIDESDPGRSVLLDCINNVIADNLIKKFGFELSTKANLCNFWLTLVNLVAPFDSVKKTSGSMSLDESRTKDMILYIEEHYADKITLDELAASVHISKSECCRCFKRALNLTPIDYLLKYRVSVAAGLIQSKDSKASSFSELAYNVGFNNASYFNKVFKELLGCTPSEYRKRTKSIPEFDPFNKITL